MIRQRIPGLVIVGVCPAPDKPSRSPGVGFRCPMLNRQALGRIRQIALNATSDMQGAPLVCGHIRQLARTVIFHVRYCRGAAARSLGIHVPKPGIRPRPSIGGMGTTTVIVPPLPVTDPIRADLLAGHRIGKCGFRRKYYAVTPSH